MVCSAIRPKSQLLYFFFGIVPIAYFLVSGLILLIFYGNEKDPASQMPYGAECFIFALCWAFFSTYTYCRGYNLCKRLTFGAAAGADMNTAAQMMMYDQAKLRQGILVIRDSDADANAYMQSAQEKMALADQAERGLIEVIPGKLKWRQSDKRFVGIISGAILLVFLGALLGTVFTASEGGKGGDDDDSFAPYYGVVFAILCVMFCCVGSYFVRREEEMKINYLKGLPVNQGQNQGYQAPGVAGNEGYQQVPELQENQENIA